MTRTYETLAIETDVSGVAHVTLNRADKRNALSSEMIADLTDMARTLGAARETRAVVLAGAGEVFCAGGDLAWMKAQIGADRATRMREARKLAEMLQALNEMPTPLIGRIHGGAFGGGVGLACVCDVAITAETASFGLTETRLGLIPATIGPYVIARLGEGMARRIFMSGRVFGAEEAARIGIVARAVPENTLDEAIAAEVKPYLSAAPGAVGAAKALTRALGARIDDAVIDDTIRRLADTWEDPEALAGIEAFFAKTPPPWKSGSR
jgi:methylglutaconyl-CoA hydratase